MYIDSDLIENVILLIYPTSWHWIVSYYIRVYNTCFIYAMYKACASVQRIRGIWGSEGILTWEVLGGDKCPASRPCPITHDEWDLRAHWIGGGVGLRFGMDALWNIKSLAPVRNRSHLPQLSNHYWYILAPQFATTRRISYTCGLYLTLLGYVSCVIMTVIQADWEKQ
jgi:hypothetical protein